MTINTSEMTYFELVIIYRGISQINFAGYAAEEQVRIRTIKEKLGDEIWVREYQHDIDLIDEGALPDELREYL